MTIRPQIAFMTLVGNVPKLISTPVAGQDRCVEVASGAVGLPRRDKAACWALVR